MAINHITPDSDDRNSDKKPHSSSRQPSKRSTKRPIESIEERLCKGNLSVQEQLRWSGALCIQDLLRQSSAFRIHNELPQGLFGLEEQLRRSGIFDIQEILRASPTFQFQKQLRYGLFDMQEQLRQSGAFGVQEALRDSPVFRMREQLGRGLLGLQEQLRQSAVLDMQEMLPDSTATWLQEQLRRCLLGFQEQFESYGLLGIQNALRNVTAENLLFEISHIQNPLDCLRELAEFINQEEIGNEMLQIGSEGTASLAGETATAAEIELAFRELFDHLKDYFTDIQTRLIRLRKPVRALIGWFISNLLIPLLVSLYFQQQGSLELRDMQGRLELEGIKTRQEIIAAIKKLEASGTVGEDTNYRVVIGDGVRIRARPRQKASVKGFLSLGTVVRFVEKHGPWTAVEYIDPDGRFIESGWVFNKYLRRIKLK